MKVLWLSATPALYDETAGTGRYGGSGWISSLQRLVMEKAQHIELAVSFITHSKKDKKKTIFYNVSTTQPSENTNVCSTTYYPIFQPEDGNLKKITTYYGGYKKNDEHKHVTQIQDIIHDFQPEVIQLFGIENELATILGKTNVPVIVHLQGLLGPYDNAFFPHGMNKSTFLWPMSVREWVLRNGFIFAKNSIHSRAQFEAHLFKKVRYCMGRTNWDMKVSQLLAPDSEYFVVNEVLRPSFYLHAGQWQLKGTKFIITSTVSETVYKGLDVILKTAKILKDKTDLDFEWHVVGVNKTSSFVRFFERHTLICSYDVDVHYMGVMAAEQLVENFLESSVYVHPSYIENSPNSVCEAQMVGLPVICCNVGGVSTLLDEGKSGILVPANAPYELAYELKQLATDSSIGLALSEAGIKSATKRHDRDSILKSLIMTYQSVIKTNSDNT